MIKLYGSSNSKYFAVRAPQEVHLYQGVPARILSRRPLDDAKAEDLLRVANNGDLFFQGESGVFRLGKEHEPHQLEEISALCALIRGDEELSQLGKVDVNIDGRELCYEKIQSKHRSHQLLMMNMASKQHLIFKALLDRQVGQLHWAISPNFKYLVTAQARKKDLYFQVVHIADETITELDMPRQDVGGIWVNDQGTMMLDVRRSPAGQLIIVRFNPEKIDTYEVDAEPENEILRLGWDFVAMMVGGARPRLLLKTFANTMLAEVEVSTLTDMGVDFSFNFNDRNGFDLMTWQKGELRVRPTEIDGGVVRTMSEEPALKKRAQAIPASPPSKRSDSEAGVGSHFQRPSIKPPAIVPSAAEPGVSRQPRIRRQPSSAQQPAGPPEPIIGVDPDIKRQRVQALKSSDETILQPQETLKLAESRGLAGDTGGAIQVLTDALGTASTQPPWRSEYGLLLGELLFKQGRPGEALQALGEALREARDLSPERTSGLELLVGEVLLALGRHAEAYQVLEPCLRLVKELGCSVKGVRCRELLGDASLALGRSSQAAEFFDSALEARGPDYPAGDAARLWCGLSKAQQVCSERSAAEQSLEQAIRLLRHASNPGLTSSAYRQLAELLLEMGRAEEAVIQVQIAFEEAVTPTLQLEALNFKYRTLVALGRGQEGIVSLEMAVGIARQMPTPIYLESTLLGLVEACLAEKRLDSASRHLRELNTLEVQGADLKARIGVAAGLLQNLMAALDQVPTNTLRSTPGISWIKLGGSSAAPASTDTSLSDLSPGAISWQRWLRSNVGAAVGSFAVPGVAALIQQAHGFALIKYFLTGLVILLVWLVYKESREMRISKQVYSLIEDACTAHAMGQVDKAKKVLKQALDTCMHQLGERTLANLMSVHCLGNVYRVGCFWTEAETLYRRALPTYFWLMGQRPATAGLLRDLALSLEGQKRTDEAEAAVREALRILDRRPKTRAFADSLCLLGRLLGSQGKDEEAALCYSRALEVRRQRLALDSQSALLVTLMAYSRILFKLKRFDETDQHLTMLIEQIEHGSGIDYPTQVDALQTLGTLRLEQDRYAESESLFLRALGIVQHYVGPTNPLLQKTVVGYGSLVERCASPDADSVLNLLTLIRGNTASIRTLLDQPQWINTRDATGWGPLQWATFVGRDDVVRWLLDRGVNPNCAAEDYMGPLHVAAAWSRREALQALLVAGADVNGRGPGGWTPLFFCCHTGEAKLAELLIKDGAEVNVRDNDSRTPLHVASAQGSAATIGVLLNSDASIMAKDKETGQTPLHLACARGHMAACECLIFNKGDLKAGDIHGLTPLNLAEKAGHRLLVKAMKKHLWAGIGH